MLAASSQNFEALLIKGGLEKAFGLSCNVSRLVRVFRQKNPSVGEFVPFFKFSYDEIGSDLRYLSKVNSFNSQCLRLLFSPIEVFKEYLEDFNFTAEGTERFFINLKSAYHIIREIRKKDNAEERSINDFLLGFISTW